MRMRLTRSILWLGAAALIALPAAAVEVAPDKVAFTDYAVAAPLTGVPGDPVNGAKVFADRKLGNCLACHENAALPDQLFQGNVGPPLDGVADRYEVAQMRAIVANAKEVFGPETTMPGFYTLKVGLNVAADYAGKTILTAQEVEDVVAYLATMKE